MSSFHFYSPQDLSVHGFCGINTKSTRRQKLDMRQQMHFVALILYNLANDLSTSNRNSSESQHEKQAFALTKRNRTGLPCSVGRPTAHALGPAAADHQRTRRLARPPAGSVTDDDRCRQQTTTDDRHLPAKQYWTIRRVSNNYCNAFHTQYC